MAQGVIKYYTKITDTSSLGTGVTNSGLIVERTGNLVVISGGLDYNQSTIPASTVLATISPQFRTNNTRTINTPNGIIRINGGTGEIFTATAINASRAYVNVSYFV